ncbi:MAG TPA: glycosyltransferase [Candidatus Bathyarchaeia archaeon]|nr:glycosyltransferase [Candidatus Bathyarchaeia archaeon]
MYSHPIGDLSRGAVLDVGLKCTHQCKFCYYSYLDRSDDQFRGMRRAAFRSLDDCKEILRRLKAAGFINFDYTGGEPTLHPDIVEITRYAHRELGLKGRVITLGQFLMKRMPNCRTERLIDDLLEAGLTNFLLSVHAVDDELYHRITDEQFPRLRAAMEHLDRRDFHYCSNTTVFEWNREHLPEIAREIVRHKVYLHNFIIMNAYYEWNRDGRAFGVQARYSQIAPYLREAVEILESNGVAVNIRYAPMCAVRGLERNLVGMVGVRYDPHEWMNQAGHFGGSPEFCAQPLPLRRGDIDPAFAYRPVQARLANGVEVTGMRGEQRKLFAGPCRDCSAREVCDGIDPNYLAQYGDGELAPYREGDFTSPVHGARAAYPPPFRVKTEQDEDMLRPTAALLAALPRVGASGEIAPAAAEQITAGAAGRSESTRPAATSEPGALLAPGMQVVPPGPPRVSVIVTCYNYGRYLAEAVVSVLAQTYRDHEIIIVDDGSTDDTPGVVAQLVDAYGQRGVRALRQANSGQPALARNRGIAEARGEYVLCLDADDLIAPTMLEECVRLLDQDPSVAIAYTDRRDFDGVSGVVQAGEYDFARLRFANHLSYCALFRKQVWQAVGGFRSNVKGVEDWDFWVAAGARGYFGRRIPQALFCYRRHDSGIFQDVLKNFPALTAQVILNNREAYEDEAVRAAERLLREAPGAREAAADLLEKPAQAGSPAKAALVLRPAEAPIALPPLVSVVIPTYNRPDRLRRAVESVLGQTHENVEVIVVNDDGGPVEELLADFAESSKIVYVKLGVNRERSAARNAGLALARGEFVAYLDDDDWYEPEHVATLVAALRSSGAAVAYSDARRAREVRSGDGHVVEGFDRPYSQDFDRELLLVTNYIPINCVMHRRSCLTEVGSFDERLETHEDWDFLLRLALRHDFVHVARSTCVFTWREDGSSTTSQRRPDFVRTAQAIHARYAEIAARFPRVKPSQTRFLAEMRASAPERRFECSIVVPVKDRLEATRQCLLQVAEWTRGIDYEVILVDNASRDETGRFLAALEGDVQVLRNAVDPGLAASLNQGARAARGRFLVFLSPLAVPREGWLRALLDETLGDASVHAVGSKILRPDGSVRHAGISLAQDFAPVPDHRGAASSDPAVNQSRPVEAASWECLLVRRDAFSTAGGFDEGFSALADVDLCLRLSTHGGRIIYQPRSSLYFVGSDADAAERGQTEELPRLKERHARSADAAQARITLPAVADDALAAARQALVDGRLDDAAEHIDALLVRSPGDGEAWLLRGVWSIQHLDYAGAAGAFAAAQRHGADPCKARLGLGMAALGQGHAERAWSLLSDLAAEFPADADCIHWLLRAGSALERWQELVPPLAAYLARKPEDSAVRFALAGVKLRLGDWAGARADYEGLRRSAPALTGLDDLGRALAHAPGRALAAQGGATSGVSALS